MREAFNIFIDFVRQGFANLAFAWQQGRAIRRIRRQIEGWQSEIIAQQAVIGKVVYHQQDGMPEGTQQIGEAKLQIAALEEKVIALEQDILSIQKQKPINRLTVRQVRYVALESPEKKCHNCQSIVPRDSRHCPHCGRIFGPAADKHAGEDLIDDEQIVGEEEDAASTDHRSGLSASAAADSDPDHLGDSQQDVVGSGKQTDSRDTDSPEKISLYERNFDL